MDRLPNRYRTQVTAVSWYGLEWQPVPPKITVKIPKTTFFLSRCVNDIPQISLCDLFFLEPGNLIENMVPKV